VQTLLEIVAALSVAHSLHGFAETGNVRRKIDRLTDAVNGMVLKPYPVNINTRAKAYAAGVIMPVVLAAIAYGVLRVLSLTTTGLLVVALAALVITELVTTVSLDKYHVIIQKLINKFDKKLK
jgi:hypothetical protein